MPAAAILAFLREIGLTVVEGDVPDAFLPGILVRDGSLTVDAARLRFPGDLLHEAGHLAVLAPDERRRFGTDDTGLDMTRIELRAIAWSFAASVHLGLDPAVVFHEGGYQGKGASLAMTYGLGVYPGAAALEEIGMTRTRGERPYPHMTEWLRSSSPAPSR